MSKRPRPVPGGLESDESYQEYSKGYKRLKNARFVRGRWEKAEAWTITRGVFDIPTGEVFCRAQVGPGMLCYHRLRWSPQALRQHVEKEHSEIAAWPPPRRGRPSANDVLRTRQTYKKMWQHITGETSEPEVQKEEEVILDQIVVRSLSDTSSSGEDVESLNSDEVSVEEAEEEVESEEGAEPEQEAEPEERVELEEVEETADSQEDGSDDEPSVTNTSKGKQRALSSSLSPSPAPTVWTEDNAFDPPFPRGEPWVPKPNRLWDLDIPTSLKLKLEKYAFSVIRVTEKYAISRRDPDEISEGVEEAEQSLPIRARQARASWAIDSDDEGDEGDEPAMDEYISHTMEEPQERPSSSQTHYPLDSDDDDDELSTEDDTVQTIGEPQKRPSNQTDIIVLSDDDISDEDEYMRIDKPPQEPVSRSQTRNTLEAVAEESDDQERQSIEAREMPSFRIERTSKPAQAGRSIADITPTYADDEPRAVIFAKQDI